MGYQSLARTYRPVRFSDLVGQESVARALQNSITLGREPRAVIFSGVRGIGKTTTARLYAKLLNCSERLESQEMSGFEPCGLCYSCQAIAEGRHEDVLEIDGASNTGVDDVRALQETLGYVPQRSRFKVYIIDEVHMLSQSAFNALLKTLEEPPPHVVFVFATTELQKVPETILSRCQTFHLRRLSIAQIMDRLRAILEAESIAYETQALALIAKEGRGSMRDALTFTDQVIAVGNGRVSAETLATMIKGVSSKPYLQMLDSLLQRQGREVLQMVADWDQQGLLFTDICESLAKIARHGFVVRDLGADSLEVAFTGLDPDEAGQLQELVHRAGAFDLNRIFRTLVQCRKDLDGSALDRFIFENYLLEWCFDPGLPDLETIGRSLSSGGRPVAGSRQPVKLESRESGSSELSQDSSRPSSDKPMASLTDRLKRSLSSEATRQKHAVGSSAAKSLENTDQKKVRAQSSRGPELQEKKAPVANTQANKVADLPEPTHESQPVASEFEFPSDWRSLVEIWKTKKPLQARLLEETYATHFDKDLIQITVSGSNFASAKLRQIETVRHLEQEFSHLFGFRGRLELSFKESSQSSEASPSQLSGASRQESVAEEKTSGGDLAEKEATTENSASPAETAGSSIAEDSAMDMIQETIPQPSESIAETTNTEEELPRNETQPERVEQETILEERMREKQIAREQFRQELLAHPVTKEALAIFQGKVKEVRIEG